MLQPNNAIRFLFLLAICGIFATCKKDDVPPADSFYFKCKVNGVDYMPDNCASCTQCEIIGDTTLIFRGNRNYETLGTLIKDLTQVKAINYPLNDVNGRVADYKNSTVTNDRYFTDATHTGNFTITEIDRTNKIMKGSFSFDAYNSLRNKEVHVTEGSFRLKYSVY